MRRRSVLLLPLALLALQAALVPTPTDALAKAACEDAFADQYKAVQTKISACEQQTGVTMALPLMNRQKDALCSTCSDLVAMVQKDHWPLCWVIAKHKHMNLRTVMRQLFAPCANATSSADDDSGSQSDATDTSLTPTKRPTASPAAAAGASSAPATQTVESQRDSSAIGTGAIIGIVAGGIAVVLVIGCLVVRHRRQRSSSDKFASADLDVVTNRASASPFDVAFVSDVSTRTKSSKQPSVASSVPSTSSSNKSAALPQLNVWDDAVIVAARIPKDKVVPTVLLSRGGFGEVYRGVYNHKAVAIKTLLPERRKDMMEISAFLYEIKLMASLEHDRIVTFVGVAWDSLTDLCVVTEFMDRGDLRGLLVQFERLGRRRGFDTDKIKIALHVAHALTYLHSLRPVVLHRDLKSKNVLLDSQLNAKLTDFGVSRERSDTTTMTAGVGTSLWMAPEVMLGERYDEKSDIFSFGVVLSELDTHAVPYNQMKAMDSGHRIPDSALLQMVSLGRLTVQFTLEDSIPEMVALGKACVSVDPKDRPTAADVLYTLHNILKSMFQVL